MEPIKIGNNLRARVGTVLEVDQQWEQDGDIQVQRILVSLYVDVPEVCKCFRTPRHEIAPVGSSTSPIKDFVEFFLSD